MISERLKENQMRMWDNKEYELVTDARLSHTSPKGECGTA